MQKGYINHAMHYLYTHYKIFIAIFELINEMNKHEL